MISETAGTADAAIEPPIDLPIAGLRERLSGRAILPRDPEYETARIVMPGAIDSRPAVIVRVANAADVASAIEFAGENGLDLAVRSGGHSAHGTTDRGLVIDVRDMKALDIDGRFATPIRARRWIALRRSRRATTRTTCSASTRTSRRRSRDDP